jgi:hypothetical protein
MKEREGSVYVACPPPCTNGAQCTEEVTCTPETCQYGQRGWQHAVHCVKHHCAHDWSSGPEVEMDGGVTASCACGMTAFSHSMMYGP